MIPQSFKDDPFLTVAEIIEITGLKRATAYNKVRFEMRRYKFGRRVFVRLSDFEKWLESQVIEPGYA